MAWHDRCEIEGDRMDADEILARNPFWDCERCGEQNSRLDGECQFCEEETSFEQNLTTPEDIAEFEQFLQEGDTDYADRVER